MGKGRPSIFTDEEKVWIRKQYNSGEMTVKELAKHFDCTLSQVYNAKRPPRRCERTSSEVPSVKVTIECKCPMCGKRYVKTFYYTGHAEVPLINCEECRDRHKRGCISKFDRHRGDITRYTAMLRKFNDRDKSKISFADANGIGGW